MNTSVYMIGTRCDGFDFKWLGTEQGSGSRKGKGPKVEVVCMKSTHKHLAMQNIKEICVDSLETSL